MANYRKKSSGSFLKRNAAYLIMIGCVLLTALIIILASKPPVTGGLKQPGGELQLPPEVEDQPVTVEPDSFLLPVAGATIGNTFDAVTPIELSTTTKNGNAKYKLFLATEFIADAGTPVVAVYDGKVTHAKHDLRNGMVIEIEHEGGLVSVYKNMQNEAKVSVGDTVKRGDTIGYVGRALNEQYFVGAHLCFSMKLNGKAVDPAGYLEI